MFSALAALVYAIPRVMLRSANPATIAICTYFAFSFLSYFLGLDFVWSLIGDIAERRNVMTILLQGTVVILTAAQQVVLMYWSYPPERAREKALRRVAVFGALLVTLIVVFLLAFPAGRRGPGAADPLRLENPRYALYMCLYIGIVAVGQIITIRLSIRYAGLSQGAWLRRGMWILAAGASFILAYCAIRYLQILGVQTGYDMSRFDLLHRFFGDAGLLLELLGWTVPAWGPPISGALQWVANYRAYRRLYPLWGAIYDLVPMIAKDAPHARSTRVLSARNLEYRIYRRVIEILDGQLVLRHFLHSDDAEAARRWAREAGCSGEDLKITSAALQLRAALRAKAAGRPAAESAEVFFDVPDGDLPGQVRWLVRLADAFTRTGESEALFSSCRPRELAASDSRRT